MGLKDILNAGKIRRENDDLKAAMSPEMQDVANLLSYKRQLEQEISQLQSTVQRLSSQVEQKKKDAIFFDEALAYQDFGLYSPRYDFVRSEQYKASLEQIRNMQKAMIKNDIAISGAKNWTVDGSASKGKTLLKDMKKLFLRAFNSDCDEVIGKVKYSNYEMSLKKIYSSANAIEKLGKIMQLSITPQYVQSKVDELTLAFEYQLKKQEEKEAQKEARAQLREAAKLQKELDEQRKKIEKEQLHYQKALLSVMQQLQSSSDVATSDLLKKKEDLEQHLCGIESSLETLDYRQANQKAGYVYIISNVGSFGENVYKIGMTRRLDPQDRVDELGDASVPFNFDVHAMIFSDNAPALEAALHRAFEDRKVNMINTRREFFYATLDEIKEVIRQNFDKTVEFIDFPEAQQYRESVAMRNHLPVQLPETKHIQSETQRYQYTKWGKIPCPDERISVHLKYDYYKELAQNSK